MVTRIKNATFLPVVLLAVSIFIYFYNLSFPYLSSDESRIAYRGYVLATTGKDELGRTMPLIFNSTDDYQLPAVSYVSALGAVVFGKTDLGARLPFILVSVLIVILIFKISGIFNLTEEFRLFSVLVAVFSPILVFLSRIPNESILLTFGLLLLFYLLTKKSIHFLILSICILFILSITKFAWWILIPFVVFTLIFFQPNLQKRTKMNIFFTALLLTTVSVIVFLLIPQANRSLSENDFALFQDPSIMVVVNKLRGQGLESHWPNFIEKILFNKLQFIAVGLLNWLSYLNPATLFGQFDKEINIGFNSMGAFPKFAIFPFFLGIISLIRKNDAKFRALIIYPLILTFPLIFTYPHNHKDMLIIVLPFLIFIVALGLTKLNRLLKITILILMILEVITNIFFVSSQIKLANEFRPAWIKPIVKDSYELSLSNKVAISDDFTSDIVPFLEWYTPLVNKDIVENIEFPYKFHQSQVSNIKIIGNDDTFYFCGHDKLTNIFASKRDLDEIKKWLNTTDEKIIINIYKDDLGKNKVYLLRSTICVH